MWTAARRLESVNSDFEPLLDLVGDARVVLLGESTHGTHDFYSARAEITKRLIVEKNFDAVAIEGDFPDAYRVHRYVQHRSKDRGVLDALKDFRRFPTWMWRNSPVACFVEWLYRHNGPIDRVEDRVGFYGLDLYSLHRSAAAVIKYLERTSPREAALARARYACFEHFDADPREYGAVAFRDPDASCEEHVRAQFEDLKRRLDDGQVQGSVLPHDEHFVAEQNARAAKNAEAYYRAMFGGRAQAWNVRDSHMAEVLEALRLHLDGTRRRPARIVVWAHNSHVGDARATEMRQRGEHNLGQLARERYGEDAVLVGFTTYRGTVSAASGFGGDVERKTVRNALEDSVEHLFHVQGTSRFVLPLRENVPAELDAPRLQRAIGVVYAPETERFSHYFYARIGAQFDAVIHLDETRAVEPLERSSRWERGELPDTYPTSL